MSYGETIRKLQIDVEVIKKRLNKIEIRFAAYVGFISGILFVINKIF